MSATPIPILCYHQIAPPPPHGTPFRSLVVAPAAFARQMALLAALGWRGLSMSALLPHLRGEARGRVFGITFDDGYRNNLEHALPALRRHGFSATCYMVSGQVGGSNVWDHAKGIAPAPLMSAGELRAWIAGGQEVGAHSRGHANLTELPAQQARDEIAGSRAELEDLLGVAVRHFCYPYGRFAPEHAGMVREAGYQTATTTERGRVRTGDDAMALPRVPVHRGTTLAGLWIKVATGWEDRHRAG